jgi:PleD family two-component response regulator
MEELKKIENTEEEKKDEKLNYEYPVLIIDDDNWMHRLISNFLRKQGLDPISALDPVEGIAAAIKYRPIAIYLDMIMPITNGTVLLQMLKRIEITSHIPVIAISGNFSQKLLKEAISFGASSFISKPFTQEILEEKLQKAIDRETLQKAATKYFEKKKENA